MLNNFQIVNGKKDKTNNQSVQPILVYIAGKVQGDKWKLIKDLPQGVASVISSDSNNHCEHLTGLAQFTLPPTEDHKNFVDEGFVKQIRKSDILIAYLDHLTCYGTIAEIAYASACGVPCKVFVLLPCKDSKEINIRENHHAEQEWPEFDAYWFVCSLPLVQASVINNIHKAKSYAWSDVYKEYHRRVTTSSHWQKIKLQAIHNAKNRCQLCNAKGHLQVHHRTYENLGNEKVEDLIVLCDKCHAKHHEK